MSNSGWQNDTPDSYTVPASVPIGGNQDGVILAGSAIPPEMLAQNITAAIMFQRGDYPSEVGPEYKYYWMGLARIGFPIVKKGLVIGGYRDNKDGTFSVQELISFPLVLDADPWPLGPTSTITLWQQILLEGGGTTLVPLGIRTLFATDGEPVNGWYDLPLTSPWSAGSTPGNYSGLQWTIDASGTAHLQGCIKTSAPAVASFITNIRSEIGIGIELPVKPRYNVSFFSKTAGALTDFVLDYDGGLYLAGGVGIPAPNTDIYVYMTYKVDETP